MGLVNSALISGRNALLSYQGALQIVGNNVANAGNADYTRQTGDLSAVPGGLIGPGLQPGAGVTLTALQRHIDEALENRLRASSGDLESATALRDALSRIEVYFDDLSGAGISQKLTAFYDSLSDVQNSPDDLATRSIALANADALARSLRDTRDDLVGLSREINDQIESVVTDADRIASDIAELNTQIAAVEAGGTGQTGALRDRRDALLRDLARNFDVTVREQPDGSINVYIGSEPLIQHGISRGLTTTKELDGQFERTSVRFADSNARVNVAGGAIEGLIQARDEQALGRLNALDDLARAIIIDTNAVHADGQGITPLRSVTSANAVDDPTAPLNSDAAGLLLPPNNGSFYITVTDDASGTPVAYRIEVDLDGVDPDTSLEDLVTSINDQVEGVTASITVDNHLQLTADTGLSFTFGHDGEQFRQDTSKTLAALGINTLFEGSGAADITVRSEVANDPGLLAAATVGRIGDGINAGRLAGLINEPSQQLGGVSILDFYNQLHNGVAAAGAAAKETAEAAATVNSSLQAERESISGVSLDEEAIDMLKFERAFQGAARYVSVVDEMIGEMLSFIR